MYEVLDQIENKGFEKGYQKGFQESILKGKKQTVLSVYAAGLRKCIHKRLSKLCK